MASASYVQPAFTGGEWSIYAQGRIDDPAYRTAMNVCRNGIPIEEGAWVRRPGTAFICTTRSGVYGRMIGFDFSDVAPFNVELTQGHARVIEGRSLVFDSAATVVDISTETPAVVTVASDTEWASADQVQFLFANANSTVDCAILRNRQFAITVINETQFTIADPVTGAPVDGSTVNFDPTQISAQVARITDFVTPYQEADIPSVRSIIAGGEGVAAADNNGSAQSSINMLLHGKYAPRVLTGEVDATAPNFSSFSFSKMAFNDGPYLNQPQGATLQPNTTGLVVTVQIGYQAWSSSSPYGLGDFATFGGNVYQSLSEVNLNNEPDTSPLFWQQVGAGAAVGPSGFVSTDVGRYIRLLSEPAAWSAGASYAAGQAVQYNGAYYIAQDANSGSEPDTNLADWLPTVSTAIATWTWGIITAVNTQSNVSVSLLGPGLIYSTVITNWMVGVYSDTTGYPTCGSWYEGRLWLGGVIDNRFDASVSNDPFNFSPTATDGTVGDANAISEEFNSSEQNTIYWMEPTSTGLLCGTKKGEWLIQASSLNDPITPTSVQAHRVTKVGCFNQIPCHTPLSMIVIQRFSRLLFEVFPDLFSGKIQAPNLNKYSKHLTLSGVAELGYQSELAPIIWARNNDGSLVGWTYRRENASSTADPKFVGGHRHDLGSGRILASMCISPTPDQTSDSVMMTTIGSDGVYHVEQMTQILDPQDKLTGAWFVDDAVTPSGLLADANGVTFFGLWHLNGKTVSVVCGGLDCGDHLVANGQVTVPYKSDPGKLFTLAYLQSLDANSYGDLAVSMDATVTTLPGTTPTPQVISELGPYPQTPVNGISSIIVKPDYANGNAFIPGNNGIRYLSLSNFSQISAATFSAINGTGPGGTPDMNWDWTYGTDGFLYFRAVGSNQSPWIKVNPANWSIVASFGTNNNFWSGGSTGLGAPDSMVSVFAGTNYVVGMCQRSAFSRQIAWVNADTFSWVPGSTFDIEDGFKGILVAGPQSSLGATVYALSVQNTLNLTPDHTTLYQSSVDGQGNIVTQTIATIMASSIDPSWTNFSQTGPAMRDAVDGQLIVSFSTATAGVTNASYVAKLRVSDGSVIWKTPVVRGPDGGMTVSRSTGGVLFWIGEVASGITRYIYVLNTKTGQINKVVGVTNVIPGGINISDDQTGRLLVFAAYLQTSGSPIPGPNSPSGWDDWSIFTAGNLFQGSTRSTARATIPAVIGFTYTSQGQLVRPQLPAEAGAQNGPALGKTRRNHMFGILAAACIYGSLSIGSVFGKLRPIFFKTPGGTPYATNTLFSGVWQDKMEGEYDFDGMIAWEIDRPLPASISSVSGFIQTQDR